MSNANINPADAPSEFKCGHCPKTMTQREVRAMCTDESDEPAYLICSSCIEQLNQENELVIESETPLVIHGQGAYAVKIMPSDIS